MTSFPLDLVRVCRDAAEDPNQKLELNLSFHVANKNLDEAAMIVGAFGSQWCSELNMSKKYGWRTTQFDIVLKAPAYLLRDFMLAIIPLMKR